MSTETLTDAELEQIADFIDNELHNAWDRYTDVYLCPGVPWEDGKRRMDPDGYELMLKIRRILAEKSN